jgi:hypothetical protein
MFSVEKVNARAPAHPEKSTSDRTKRMRYIGTLNNPEEHYPEFMLQDWLQSMHTTSKAVYTVG